MILQLHSSLLDPVEQPVQGLLQTRHVGNVNVEDRPRSGDVVQTKSSRHFAEAVSNPGNRRCRTNGVFQTQSSQHFAEAVSNPGKGRCWTNDGSVGAAEDQEGGVLAAALLHARQHDFQLALPEAELEI